jgi:hypothetical protein
MVKAVACGTHFYPAILAIFGHFCLIEPQRSTVDPPKYGIQKSMPHSECIKKNCTFLSFIPIPESFSEGGSDHETILQDSVGARGLLTTGNFFLKIGTNVMSLGLNICGKFQLSTLLVAYVSR